MPSHRVEGAILLLACVVAAGSQVPPEATPARYALLVGVSEYPRLKDKNLEGPPNDVELMRRVLESDPFKMNSSNIIALAGWPREAERRPTRANIEKAFQRLAARVGKGDQVLVLMAGHGSQQPANEEPGDPEPDGMDEIFLPADAAGWNGSTGRVENAIVDDDVRRWIGDLRNKGAFVWIVFDSCQSGTMVRGAPESIERDRQVRPEDLIPAAVLDQARKRANAEGRSRGSGGDAPLLGLTESAPGVAALYAAQMDETTPEKRLPDSNGPVHGLFTYTLVDILTRSSGSLTYRELAERILERYRSMGRLGPTPTFEGSGLDREVFGQRVFPDRPQMLLGGRSGPGWELRAGDIHGVTKNSILEVFPQAGTPGAERSLGYVKVVSAKATSAVVEPVEYNKVAAPSPERLVDGARLRIAEHNYGDRRLRVALRTTATGNRDDEFEIIKRGAGPQAIEGAFDRLPELSRGLAVRTESAADADWFVRADGDDVVLIPASGYVAPRSPKSAQPADAPPRFRAGSMKGGALASDMADALQRIARARNLMRLAENVGESGNVGLDVELIRYESETSKPGRPVRYEVEGPSLVVGEWAAFRMINTGKVPLDVTLLFLDSSYGIESLYPLKDQEIDNRIQPGQQAMTMRFEVTATTLGDEHVVAIGVPAQGPRTSFGMLRQPSLEAMKTRGAPRSPLEELLDSDLYGVGTRSGSLNLSGGVRHTVRLLSWRTNRS
jgi:hypothetical protein